MDRFLFLVLGQRTIVVFFVLQNGFCLLWVFHKPLPSATFVLYCLEHTGGISTSCSVRQKTNSSKSSLSSKEHPYGKCSAFRIKEDIRVSGFNIRIKNEHCVVIFNILLYFLSFTSFYTLFLLTLIKKKVLKKLWDISLYCATAVHILKKEWPTKNGYLNTEEEEYAWICTTPSILKVYRLKSYIVYLFWFILFTNTTCAFKTNNTEYFKR